MPLAEAKNAGAVLAYGNFLTILINFLILAFIIFQMVRLMNRTRRAEPALVVDATPPAELVLLTEIRDALRQKY